MWYEEFVKRMPLEAGYVHIREICDMLREAYGAVELPEEQIPSLKWMHSLTPFILLKTRSISI